MPDYAYFPDAEAFASADAERTPEGRLPHAVAVGDAKAWSVDFEAPNSGSRPGETAVGQTIRYLERAKIQSNRKVRWAILSNGRVWRLYYADAKSVLDGYFEADLAEMLALPGTQAKLAPPSGEGDKDRRARLFKTFVLAFRPDAFRPEPDLDGRTFHEFALAEGAHWEAKVRTNLSDVVFGEVFPGLVRALAAADTQAPNPFTARLSRRTARGARSRCSTACCSRSTPRIAICCPSVTELRRLSLSRLRDEVAERIDAGTNQSGRRKGCDRCAELFRTIDEGDDTLGVPPYNGGLFSMRRRRRTARPRDPRRRDFAPLLDALAH